MSTFGYISAIPCRRCGKPTKTLLGVCTTCNRTPKTGKRSPAKTHPFRTKFGKQQTQKKGQ